MKLYSYKDGEMKLGDAIFLMKGMCMTEIHSGPYECFPECADVLDAYFDNEDRKILAEQLKEGQGAAKLLIKSSRHQTSYHKVMIRYIAQELIIGWKNVQDEDGKDLKFTKENCAKILTYHPGITADVLKYYREENEKQIKIDKEFQELVKKPLAANQSASEPKQIGK